MSTIEVKVPDIGDFKDVPIIEVFVKPGDAVKAEDSLITLESEKTTMDVPSPTAGTVKSGSVKSGAKVPEGSAILTLETQAAAPQPPGKQAPAQTQAPAAKPPPAAAAAQPAPAASKPAQPAPG